MSFGDGKTIFYVVWGIYYKNGDLKKLWGCNKNMTK